MEISIILLSVISGFAIVLSVLSYISLQKLRTDLKTAQKEMIDLRNHVNLSIKELSNGNLLLGVSNRYKGGQLIHHSEDGGVTWSEAVSVPFDGDLDLNEGDFVELDNGVIVLYMREDNEGFTGWRSYSNDGGSSWSKAV